MSEAKGKQGLKRTDGPDGRRGNTRPLADGIERPLCARCQEAGRPDRPMGSNGSIAGEKKFWRCTLKDCGYRYTQLLREPKSPGNKPGAVLPKRGPGKRRRDDKKGQRVDLLTDTLEAIVEAPARSTELSEAIIAGREVLNEVKATPI